MARSMEGCSHNELPTQCLSKMTEIVEYVLKFLPGRSLESAALVCTLWRDIVQRIRKYRREFLTLSQAVECSSYKPLIDFSSDLNNVAIEPQAAILFTSRISTSSDIPCYMKDFKKQLKLNLQNLPRRCTLIGCTSLWVDNLGIETPSDDILEDDGRKYSVRNALVLIPRIEGIQSCSFHLPLRDKYKSISGMASFLPKMDLPVKLVIALVHPVSLGKLAGFAVRTKKEYGEETVIVGCYSDCTLFHSTNVTYNEIVGLVFAGNFKTSSIIINGSNQNDVLENLHKGLVRLKTSGMPSENAMAIIFSAPSHLRILKRSGLMKCRAFQHHYPGVPVVVAYGTAVYGCDTVELGQSGRRSGGRDFLHTGSSVLCMLSFKTSIHT